MRTRSVVGCVVLALFAAPSAQAEHFEIDVMMFRGDPKGSREAGTLEQVASPTLDIKSSEQGSVLVGGTAFVGKQPVTVGKEVSVTAKELGDGAIRVNVVFVKSELLSTRKAEAATTVQSGGKVRVEIGDDPKDKYWVDVTVRKAK